MKGYNVVAFDPPHIVRRVTTQWLGIQSCQGFGSSFSVSQTGDYLAVCIDCWASVHFAWIQLSRWKRRAEQLEILQRAVSSPERSAFDSSNSETEANECTNPAEPLLSHRMEDGAPLGPLDPVPVPFRKQKDVEGGQEAVKNTLQQELSEAKENLAMMQEELAAAVLTAREQAVKRVAAESRVGSLQVRGQEALSGRRGGEVKARMNHDDAN